MLLVNSSSVVWLFWHPGEMPPCLICAYVMQALCVCSLVLWTTHIISFSPFLMMHTRLIAAYWGFMVRLVDAFCHIKATLQLHGCQKTCWYSVKCFPCLGHCLLISFCVDCFIVSMCTSSGFEMSLNEICNNRLLKVAPINLLKIQGLNCKCKFPF